MFVFVVPQDDYVSIHHNRDAGAVVVCADIIIKYTPKKRNFIRANQANFMDNILNHAIMLRSKLRNKVLKSKSNKDKEA